MRQTERMRSSSNSPISLFPRASNGLGFSRTQRCRDRSRVGLECTFECAKKYNIQLFVVLAITLFCLMVFVQISRSSISITPHPTAPGSDYQSIADVDNVGRISCSNNNNCPGNNNNYPGNNNNYPGNDNNCPDCVECPACAFVDFAERDATTAKSQIEQTLIDWEMCATTRRSQQAAVADGHREQLDIDAVLATLANQLDMLHIQQQADRVVFVRNSDKKLLLQRYIDHLGTALQMTSTTGLGGDTANSLKTKLFEVEAELITHQAEHTLVI
jgi:hypothetical protein